MKASNESLSGIKDALIYREIDEVTDRLESTLLNLKGAKLFVTGGTGFLGRWMVETLIRANERFELNLSLSVLSRSAPNGVLESARHYRSENVEFIYGDVRRFTFPSGRYTHIIHGATEASAKLNVEQPWEMMDVIINGSKRVFEFAAAAGVRSVLNLSSGGVYGQQPEELEKMPESYVGAPKTTDLWSAYGEGKRASELIGSIYGTRFGFEHKIARIFALVGPRLPLQAHYAIGNFIHDALLGNVIVVGGNGAPKRSYLYITDVVFWLFEIWINGQANYPYNVGSEYAISIGDLASLVDEMIPPRRGITIANGTLAGQRGSRYIPATARAQTELGLQATVQLDEAIARTAAWSRLFPPYSIHL